MSTLNTNTQQSGNPSSSGGGTSTGTSTGTTTGTTNLNGQTRIYDIQHLEDDGSNFASWKCRTEMILEDLWPIVDGSEPSPGSSDPAALERWKLNDRAA